MIRTICYVAGKSGGHIMPALTLAHQHKKKYPHDKILFFSTNNSLDTQIISHQNIVDTYIPLSLENVPYTKITHYPKFIAHCLQAMARSIRYLFKHKPSQIMSMGGYISIPVCIAAWLLRIPITIVELNAVPGKATKALAPLAQTVIVCFPEAQNYFSAKKCRLEPYPIRFSAHDKNIPQQHTREQLGLLPNRTTIFVLGGSQGSLFINNAVKDLITTQPHLMSSLQFIHQTGAHDTTDWTSLYAHHNIPALVFGYNNHVEHYYRAADIIICRSGAGTLWETIFFNKKTITIPLETSTTDHQIDNARAIAQKYPHLCTVVMQQELIHNKNILAQLFIENVSPIKDSYAACTTTQ